MADRSTIDLLKEWQTGVLLLVVPLFVGGVLVYVVGPWAPPSPLVRGGLFFGGVVAAFLVLSYLAYGRSRG